MTKKERNTLKCAYVIACIEYIKAFSQKQDYEMSGIIGNYDIICYIDQYYFSLSDIIYDIDTNCRKGLIFEHHDYLLDN